MISRVNDRNVFTLADGRTFVDDLTLPPDKLPAEVQAEYQAAALRVLRGENVTPVAPMCGALLGLKRKLAKASRDEQEEILLSIRRHHRICACGKVDVKDHGNGWIWEGEE